MVRGLSAQGKLFYHLWVEKDFLNQQKMKGKIDESKQSKIRELGMTEHTVNTATRPPDTEEILTTRITHEGLTPRLHRGLLHVHKEGRPGSRPGMGTGRPRRGSPAAGSTAGTAGETQIRSPVRCHFRTTSWADTQVRQNGAPVRFWGNGNSPGGGTAGGAVISENRPAASPGVAPAGTQRGAPGCAAEPLARACWDWRVGKKHCEEHRVYFAGNE